MKAVILAGGEATRLRPLTCNIPKAMVPVLNTPFLEWVIIHLRNHGIKDYIIAQGVLAQPMQDYFHDGRRFHVSITYIQEKEPLGTAGAIKNAALNIDDTFLALNGDVLQDFDITGMIQFHRTKKAKATIALIPVDDPTHYGLIETDAERRVTRFLEKPRKEQITTNMINAGIYVLEPEVLNLIPPQTKVSIERETFPQLLDKGEPVFACHCTGYWMDAGTPEKYLQLNRDLLAGKSKLYSTQRDNNIQIAGGCNIHPDSEIKGPVIIGENCSIGARVRITGPAVIGAGCTILPGSIIEDSVLWHNIRLGPHAKVNCSIVANDCHLQEQSALHNSVLGDNVIIPAMCHPESGTIIWPGETYQTKQQPD